VIGAQLNNELYESFCVEESRNLLRAVLIEGYFAPEARPGLLEQGVINAEAFRYSQVLLQHARSTQIRETPGEAEAYEPAVRDQSFRRAVVTAYDHHCAMCDIRMLTAD
jgi:putative restriction endonuclease